MNAHAESLLSRLSSLTNFQSSDLSLNDNLQRLSSMVADIVDVENCSIMLSDDDANLRVCANFGNLSNEAYRESVKKGEGISGHVLASSASLLIEDIGKSGFARYARYSDASKKGMICVPIRADGVALGVININGLRRRRNFTRDDLHAMEIIAAFTGNIIQSQQLKRTLGSRFAQMSLGGGMTGQKISDAQNPGRMAKILAKSFYREMAGAGFGPAQIIDAASEIISELGENVNKHRGRIKRD